MRVRVEFDSTTHHAADMDYDELRDLAVSAGITDFPSEHDLRTTLGHTIGFAVEASDELGERLLVEGSEIDSSSPQITSIRWTGNSRGR